VDLTVGSAPSRFGIAPGRRMSWPFSFSYSFWLQPHRSRPGGGTVPGARDRGVERSHRPDQTPPLTTSLTERRILEHGPRWERVVTEGLPACRMGPDGQGASGTQEFLFALLGNESCAARSHLWCYFGRDSTGCVCAIRMARLFDRVCGDRIHGPHDPSFGKTPCVAFASAFGRFSVRAVQVR